MRLVRLGHKRQYGSAFLSLASFSFWEKPDEMFEDIQAGYGEAPVWGHLRLPASSYVNKLSWKQFLQPTWTLQMTNTHTNFLTATEWNAILLICSCIPELQKLWANECLWFLTTKVCDKLPGNLQLIQYLWKSILKSFVGFF